MTFPTRFFAFESVMSIGPPSLGSRKLNRTASWRPMLLV